MLDGNGFLEYRLESCRTKIFFSLRLMKIAIGDFLIGGDLTASAGLPSGAGASGAAITGAMAAGARQPVCCR